jgi:hypothetical protein
MVIAPAPLARAIILRSGQKARQPLTCRAVRAALGVALLSGSTHAACIAVRLCILIGGGDSISGIRVASDGTLVRPLLSRRLPIARGCGDRHGVGKLAVLCQ